MDGIVATEAVIPDGPAPEPVPETAPVPKVLLETWAGNERMRHVPPLSWIIAKLDGDLRQKIDILLASFASSEGDGHTRIEERLRLLGHSLDQLAAVAKSGRGNHAPNETAARVVWALNHAISSLRSIDDDLFGRRYPMQTFERSKAEPVYCTLTVVICHIDAVTEAVRQVDSRIDEKLYGSLVQLAEPMRTEPIA